MPTMRGRQDSNTTPAAIRIRDNQRRSRARHKEFVENLQQKVQEYEQRGVAATLEMQRAARDVATENARLRALLSKKGVSSDEVDSYLKSFGDSTGNAAAAIAGAVVVPSTSSAATPLTPGFDTSSNASTSGAPPSAATPKSAPSQLPGAKKMMLLEPAPAPASRNHRCERAGSTAAAPSAHHTTNTNTRQAVDAAVGIRRDKAKVHASPMSLTHLMNGEDLPPLRSRSTPEPPHQPLIKLAALADASTSTSTSASQRGSNDCCGGFTQCSGVGHHEAHGRPSPLPRPRGLDSLTEGSSSASKFGNSSSSEASMDMGPHEMSCNAAAQIIAGMHGSVDGESTRTALGCKGREECVVKNTTLFHVLEDPSRIGSS